MNCKDAFTLTFLSSVALRAVIFLLILPRSFLIAESLWLLSDRPKTERNAKQKS